MNVRQAILIELFSVVVVLFGGFYWLNESGNDFQLFVNLGLVIGIIGVLVGFVSENE